MTTPICRTCGAKFPGKDTCKTCGSDPSATPTAGARVRRFLQEAPTITVEDRRVRRARVRSLSAVPKKRKHGRNI